MSEKRILAVEIDNTLFDELDDFVKNNGLSKKQYVACQCQSKNAGKCRRNFACF